MASSCPKCSRPVAAGKPLCMYCGTVVVKMAPCPHCKVKNPVTVTACQYCHRAMRASDAPTGGALAQGLRSLDLLEIGVRKRRFPLQEADEPGATLLRRAIEHARRHEHDAAMNLVLTVMGQFPGDPAAWAVFSSVLLGLGDPASALRCAALGLEIAPGQSQLVELRSVVEGELRRKGG